MKPIILALTDQAWEKTYVEEFPQVYVRRETPKLKIVKNEDGCKELLTALNTKAFVWNGRTLHDEDGTLRIYEEV